MPTIRRSVSLKYCRFHSMHVLILDDGAHWVGSLNWVKIESLAVDSISFDA